MFVMLIRCEIEAADTLARGKRERGCWALASAGPSDALAFRWTISAIESIDVEDDTCLPMEDSREVHDSLSLESDRTGLATLGVGD